MKRELSLDGSWRFAAYEVGLGERQGAHRDHYDTSGWLDASIPGSTCSHLLAAGLQWMPGKEWWYRTEFLLLPDFPSENALLVFHRLSSATVWLNGTRLPPGSASFEVSSLLQPGPNTIAIRFASGSNDVSIGSVRIRAAEKVVGCRF